MSRYFLLLGAITACLVGNSLAQVFAELKPSPKAVLQPEFNATAMEEGLRAFLGLYRQGHASLDYRLRDAVSMKEALVEVLDDLHDHLQNLVAITNGERAPFEQGQYEDNDTDSSSSGSDSEGTTSSLSQASFNELEYRMRSLTDRINALYALATKIRNPRNRPQRDIQQLFKNVPEDIRGNHIQEREGAESAIIAYLHREELSQIMKAHGPVDHYANSASWLIRRIAVANVRRKQQFVYWKSHAERLRDAPAPPPQMRAPIAPARSTITAKTPLSLPLPPLEAGQQRSLATSATKFFEEAVKEGDTKSAISHQSRLSTVMDSRGVKLQWPLPPTPEIIGTHFTCPYCWLLCPEKYLSGANWRLHLAHDLQPYQCTYEDCGDPNRIYGSRQEWINHESQHIRVWHCEEGHAVEEFETQPEYVHHLKSRHADASAEKFSTTLVASVVGPSTRPHRDCPLCPTIFNDVVDMHKHMAFHLERFALLALPPLSADAGSNSSDATGRGVNSNAGLHHGRRDSISRDFPDEPDLTAEDFEQTRDKLEKLRVAHMEGLTSATSSYAEVDNLSDDPEQPPNALDQSRASGESQGQRTPNMQARHHNSLDIYDRKPETPAEAKQDAARANPEEGSSTPLRDSHKHDQTQHTTDGIETASTLRIAIAGDGPLFLTFLVMFMAERIRGPHAIILLTPYSRSRVYPPGCQVCTVAFSKIEELQFVLQGVDLVISFVGGVEQLNLIEACGRARVRRFVPYEFEGPLDSRPNPDLLDVTDSKPALDQLRQWATSPTHRMPFTVFSCGIFYEMFFTFQYSYRHEGLKWSLRSRDSYLINIETRQAEIPAAQADGKPVKLVLTCLSDVARYFRAAIELGIDNWPREFRMRGTSLTPQQIVSTLGEITGVKLAVSARPYAELLRLAQSYKENGHNDKWLAIQHLIDTADGRYTFDDANLNDLVDFRPRGCQEWLKTTWYPNDIGSDIGWEGRNHMKAQEPSISWSLPSVHHTPGGNSDPEEFKDDQDYPDSKQESQQPIVPASTSRSQPDTGLGRL
ncbi:hypothetical protein F4778DRAFT_796844 [Xylariomycetidae sp. FL2044]|nr:hypothetical protein F4778DRAFT_796844 [Xylariomycetidae sp. FL2044]